MPHVDLGKHFPYVIKAARHGPHAPLTLLLIEHDMDVLRGAVDEIAVLHHGEYAARGSVEEIQQNELVRELYLGKQVDGARRPTETAGIAGTESGGGLV